MSISRTDGFVIEPVVPKDLLVSREVFEFKDSIPQEDSIIEKIIKKFTKSLGGVLWYNESQPYVKEIDSTCLKLKIKTAYHVSSNYCVYKVKRLIKALQQERVLKAGFVFKSEYLTIEKTTGGANNLSIQIPLSALNHEIDSKELIRVAESREGKSFLPESPYLVNIHSPEKRELLLWSNPLYGNKTLQKGSHGTCWYNVLNYIRERYKENIESTFLEKRNLEKLWSNLRFEHQKLCSHQSYLSALVNELVKGDELGEIERFSLPIMFEILNNHCETPHSEDYLRYYKEFVDYLKMYHLQSHINREMLLQIFDDYSNSKLLMLHTQFLTEKLHINYNRWIVDFYKTRGIEIIGKVTLSLYTATALINSILREQQNKAYDISLSSWIPEQSFGCLLDEIEKQGPHIFYLNGCIEKQADSALLSCHSGFNIYELDQLKKIPGKGHCVIGIGGEITQDGKEFIYFIDPNDEYSYQKKPPVYKLSFDKFKSELISFYQELPIKSETCIDNKPEQSFIKYFTLFGRHGLSLTRDPVSAKVDMDVQMRAP